MCGETNFRAHIGSLWLLAVSWGFYVPLYCTSLHLLAKKRTVHDRAFSMVSTLSFTQCTADMVINYLMAFLCPSSTCNYQCTAQSCVSCGAETERTIREIDIYNLLDIVHTTIGVVIQFAVNALLIWRCYVVWNRNYQIVAFPIICLLVTTGACFYNVYIMTEVYLIRLAAPVSETKPPAKWLRFTTLTRTFATVTASIPVALSIIATFLIVGRILWMTKDINKFEAVWHKRNKTYSFIILVMIESGALLLVLHVLQLVAKYTNATFYEMILVVADQIIGIAPTLLICLLSLVPAGPSDAQVSNVGGGR